jgi:hypothetical protein
VSPALSAPWWRSPVVLVTLHLDVWPCTGEQIHATLSPMLLRMLREPVTGRPGPLARLLALLLVIGLVAITGPVLVEVVRWVASLL